MKGGHLPELVSYMRTLRVLTSKHISLFT